MGITTLVLTAACIGTSIPTMVPNAVDTIVAATMRAITPANTATVPPSATPLVTPTFEIPTRPPVGATLIPPDATRINFLSNATTGIVTGSISPGQTQFFVLNASVGQPLIVMVNSLNNDVTLSIRTQGGTWMLNAAAHQTSWQSMLPKTEDYYIGVYGGATTENFTLTTVIPSRIKFDPGSITTTVNGKTVAGYNVAYTVLALKGQLMTVYLNGAGNNAALTIYGYTDGQPYLRSVTEQTSFNFKLPATQDYIIEVVPKAGLVVNYSLQVIIK